MRTSGFLLSGQAGHVVGKVEYRHGEGPLREIPQGMMEIRTTTVDAVVRWSDGASHGLSAMRVANFCGYLADGAIIVANKPPMPA
jgi:hypothetical protein